jgi:hypothetical protein
MNKPGLSIESAASVVLRDAMLKHFHVFSETMRRDHAAGKSVHAEYVNGLAGVIAIMVTGGQGSKVDIINGTVAKLLECVDRDLRHLGR